MKYEIILDRFDRLVTYLLPSLEEGEHNYSFSRNRLRAALIISVLMAIFIPVIGLFLYFYKQDMALSVFTLLSLVLSVMGITAVKRGGLFLKYHDFFLIYTLLMLTVGSCFTGGFNSLFLFCLIPMPFAASHLGRPVHTMFCWLYCFLAFIGIFVAQYVFKIIPSEAGSNVFLEATKLVTILLVISIIGFVSLLAQKHRERLLMEIDEQNKQINDERGKMFHSQKLQSLGEMAAGIAHEINNPLAVILGKNQQVMRALSGSTSEILDKPSLIEKCRVISSTVFRITKIIQGMKDFARDSSNEERSEVLVSKLVEDSMALCTQRFVNNGINIQAEIVKDFTVACQHIRMSQVIVNLLNNAYDAAVQVPNPYCRVVVSEACENHCRIQVIDNGRGIDPQIEHKIFEPFFSTKPIGQGTGIGLSISRGIAQENLGSLDYNRIDQETIFEIKLPIVGRPITERQKY